MRRDGRSGLTEGRNEYILPNYSTFGIMNTVGNLFHQIEEISVAPRTVLMIYQLTAISWLSIGLTMDRHNVYFDIVADQCTEATRVHQGPRGKWQPPPE